MGPGCVKPRLGGEAPASRALSQGLLGHPHVAAPPPPPARACTRCKQAPNVVLVPPAPRVRAVFGDFELTSARMLRAIIDSDDLGASLMATLGGADLQRTRALSGERLRSALVVAMGGWRAGRAARAVAHAHSHAHSHAHTCKHTAHARTFT